MNFRGETQTGKPRNVSQLGKNVARNVRVLKDDQNWLRVAAGEEEDEEKEQSSREAKFESKGSDDEGLPASRNMRNLNRIKTSPKELLQGPNEGHYSTSSKLKETNPDLEMISHHQTSCKALLGQNNIDKPEVASNRIVRRHLPHCIHNHARNCPKHQHQIQQLQKPLPLPVENGHEEEEEEAAQGVAAPPLSNSATVVRKNTTYRQLKYYKQPDKYLLVEYRPSQEELQSHLNGEKGHKQESKQTDENGVNRNKTNTIKFISQLYFLLHLSAILSLLLHHKNLLAGERRLLAKQAFMQQAGAGQRHHVRKHSAAGDRAHSSAPSERNVVFSQPPTTTTTTTTSPPPAFDMLPEPQKLQLDIQSKQTPSAVFKPPTQLVGSVIVSSSSFKRDNEQTGNATKNRLARQAETLEQQQNLGGSQMRGHHSSDILVQLVGYWHAKSALQYFLCYLLSSSVTILVCIRLGRMCCFRKKRQFHRQEPASPNWTSLATNYGFYYRTRLDCTPVLIGSISLGLIQLIVIGLEVANNINWLSGEGRRWPIYLPSLQFAFVSLLMQFILSKVAKNHEQKERLPTAGKETVAFVAKRRKAFSISHQQNPRKGAELFENNGHSSSWWRLSNGFHNIALAHLLVTHILLWLMKLNSISLFQSIELQVPFEQPPSTLLLNNLLLLANQDLQLDSQQNNQHQFSTSDSSPASNFLADNSAALPERELNQDTYEQPTNRLELESILRRKSISPVANLTRQNFSTEVNANEPFGGLNQQQPKRPIEGGAAKAIETFSANKTIVSPDLPGVKNERGMRSAGVKLKLDQNEPDSLPSENTTISMSHGQLMRLLSMAANGQTRLVGLPPATTSKQNTTPAPPIVQANTLFKSSLPKRMTAFRQSSPRPTTGILTLPESVRPATSGRAQLPLPPASTTVAPPKQRARIIISHQQEPEVAGEANKKPVGKIPTPPTERPFPSMELATQAARDKAAVTSQDNNSSKAKLFTGLEKPIQVSRGKPLFASNNTKEAQVKQTPLSPPPAIVENEVDSDSEEVDGEGDSSEDDESSAFQLPPVPNYNETSGGEEEPESAPAPATRHSENQLEFPIMRKPRVLSPEEKKPKEKEELKEQALVFNEAASAVEPSVTKAPQIQTNKTDEANNNTTLNNNNNQTSSLPKPEAQRKQAELPVKDQPSFADYLLPIVHQYHILIIAILFNMWLDSLRKGGNKSTSSPRINRPPNRRFRSLEAASSSTSCSDFNSEPKFPVRSRIQHNHRSRSVNSLHRLDEHDSSGSSLSRYNSLRSWSSQRQLLWISSSQLKGKHQQPPSGFHKWEMPPFTSMTGYNRNSPIASELGYPTNLRRPAPPPLPPQATQNGTHPVCSVFFGLLVVSGSLIVMILGIDLLSVLAQCAAQFISILVCFLGLCFIWKFSSKSDAPNRKRRRATLSMGNQQRKNLWLQSNYQVSQIEGPKLNTESHRQCFHYLFLLAAYYCGISIALNLTSQYSIHHLFSQQVIQFGQRYLNQWTSPQWLGHNYNQINPSGQTASNYLLLFHLILALKGLLLILQVTLQTILIRSSCQRATRDLRQVYTFLMFANLSLWAMEICEQQQHLQRDVLELDPSDKSFKLMTLDSFTRFAASIVTLSHLYHGLVFMQH